MNKEQAMNGTPATRQDLRAAEQRLDDQIDSSVKRLDRKIDSVAAELVRTQGRMAAMEERLLRRMSQDTSRILRVVEDYAGQVGKLDRRQVIADYLIHGLDKRVAALESGRRLPS